MQCRQLKVRIHAYAWAGRAVSRLVPPAGRDPSIPLLRLVQFCYDQSQQDYAGHDQSYKLRRDETAPPDAARPVQALCAYASLGLRQTFSTNIQTAISCKCLE